jgi:uncharacterized damage-inducible protein DinB
MDPVKTYDYLTKAREKVFDAVRALTPEQYARAFGIGLRTLGSTLTHTMIVEWAYTERLQRHDLPPYQQWPIQDENPPPFAVIEKAWREQAPRTRVVLAAVHDWDGEFTYVTSRPQDQGRKTEITVSASDVFTQLVVHEVHHRAQVMAMLRELGTPLQDLDYAYFMYKRREVG